jgi:hypothetical protein
VASSDDDAPDDSDDGVTGGRGGGMDEAEDVVVNVDDAMDVTETDGGMAGIMGGKVIGDVRDEESGDVWPTGNDDALGMMMFEACSVNSMGVTGCGVSRCLSVSSVCVCAPRRDGCRSEARFEANWYDVVQLDPAAIARKPLPNIGSRSPNVYYQLETETQSNATQA